MTKASNSISSSPRLPIFLPVTPIRRFFSRIAIRVMAFNLLLLFLPFAGILYLGFYEKRLEAAQERSMRAQARVLAATLSNRGELNQQQAEFILDQLTPSPLDESRSRLRVLDTTGRVIADSYHPDQKNVERGSGERIRQNWLYRVGAFVVRPISRIFLPPEPTLRPAELYERADRLVGPEVRSALRGQYGADTRYTTASRAVTLYTALPVVDKDEVIGVAHASQSTYAILQDLYPVRLGLFRIFVVSLTVAIILSLLVATTIVRPLRQLRQDAGAILDRRGRLKGVFKGSRKLDEIGELSRALERLTRRLEGHVKFIESFASDVSHEFKNPLASIRTASEMLAEVEEPAERRRFSKMVGQEIARMESLLTGVREITFIDAQLATEAVQPVAVDQLLGQIVEGFRLRGAMMKFELQAEEGPLVVEASAERLTQIFENVIDNAVSFSAPGGMIRSAISRKNGSVVVTIADQGPGIPAAHVEKIFDRFFTYREGADRRKSAHTGLGLAIVKAIVEGYGGTVSASNSPQGGAIFEIRLPASQRR
jgi:two-component system sensor histidine kinase ChvG